MKKDNVKALLIVAIVLTLVAGLGATYAYFNYNKEGNSITLEAGDLDVTFANGVNYISVDSAYSLSDEMGMISPYYTDFTLTGSTDEHPIKYEIQIVPDATNTLDSKYIKVYLTDLNDKPIIGYESPINYEDLSNATRNSGKNIYETTIYGERDSYTKSNYNVIKTTTSESYRLRVWIDENYTENVSNSFGFTIKIYATNDSSKNLFDQVKTTLASNLLGIDSEEIDGQNIISGDNNINNYVWYSGKLWRIIALNNDGSVKVMTDDPITIINYNVANNPNFEGSYVYQWLNEDFLDTLYNYQDIIVVDSVWNATMASTNTKVENTTPVTAPVGLITAYEYTQSYSKATTTTGYLYSKSRFFTITPHSAQQVKYVINGAMGYIVSNWAAGLSPVINFRPGILIASGDGSFENPYTVIGDITTPIPNTTTLVSRISGEYVKFNDKLYRIVDTLDQKTKIVAMNSVYDGETLLTKSLTSTQIFGSNSNTQTDSYWDYYLNNTWYQKLDVFYRKMIVDGTYYMGLNNVGINYKSSICANAHNDVPIHSRVDHNGVYKEGCEKISDFNSYFVGKVATIRIGEMFAVSDLADVKNPTVWTLSRDGGSSSIVYTHGDWSLRSHTQPHGIRPSVYLDKDVIITSGKGTKDSPFEIKLAK